MTRRNTKFLFSFLLLSLALSGCNPMGNPGDLVVGSNAAGIISNGVIIGSYAALYGEEVGHKDSRRLVPAYTNNNLLLALIILTPPEDTWQFSGSGSNAAPWYNRLGYRERWMHYPHTAFIKPEKNGKTFENWEKREFNWEFDGRSRSIRIADNTYPISAGGLVIVRFDRDWNPEVAIGEESLDTMQIRLEGRKIISECFKTLRLGIHALTNACIGPA